MEDDHGSALGQVSPYSTQRRRYKPKVGDTITVTLPGEKIRARIDGVASEDAVVCTVLGAPIAKTGHGVMKDDVINVRRGDDSIGMEAWVMITEREMQQREAAAKFMDEERAKVAAVEDTRIAEIRAADLAAQDEAKKAADLAKTPWFKRGAS